VTFLIIISNTVSLAVLLLFETDH